MRWLILLLAMTASGQEILHSSAPRVLSKVEPQFSQEAIIGRLEGTVVVHTTIGVDGVPGKLSAAPSLGLGLDEEAVACVGKWRFQPAASHGETIPEAVTIEVNFRPLTDLNGGHLSGAKFDVPQGASRPVLLSAKFPRVWEPSGPVTLLFQVNESGSAEFVRAKDGGSSEWARDLIAAMSEWKFKPAMKDGAAVRVPAEFTFSLP